MKSVFRHDWKRFYGSHLDFHPFLINQSYVQLTALHLFFFGLKVYWPSPFSCATEKEAVVAILILINFTNDLLFC